YQLGLQDPSLMNRYKEALTPLSSYRFGTFRSPEVLVMASILPESIEVMGKALDIPILYESSELLYLNNMLEKHEETYKDSGNHLLYAFYTYLQTYGKITRFEDKAQQLAVFIDEENSEYAVLKIPSGGRLGIDG
ncbi:MAG: hypothetical protein N2376_08880, partial [Clostridia bacterium]|nr:hypothetical protein [Clostridia bacterium]